MSVKLQDVAKKAGVSITTCSLILNNKPINITDDTKKAVLNAAQELGYIRKNKVPNIGLIVPDLENLYYTEVVKKLSLKAREKNHNLVIMDSDNDLNQELINVNTMLHTDIDGLIMALIPSEENLNQLRPVFRDFMERKHIPVIIMDSNYPSLNCHSDRKSVV